MTISKAERRRRSAAAKVAPREGGRFAKRSKTYIIIDDFGDVVDYSKLEPTFGYAASITEDLAAFEGISRAHRKELGRPRTEKKASKDTQANQIKVSKRIFGLGVDCRATYVDKASPPTFWVVGKRDGETNKTWRKRKAAIRREVLDRAIDDSLEGKIGEVEIIIDRHSAYSRIADLCKSKSTEKRTVTGNTYDSAHGRYHNALQTQDYVANAAYSDTKGYPRRREILKIRMKKLREDAAHTAGRARPVTPNRRSCRRETGAPRNPETAI